MKEFKLINNLTGWATFLFALAVYILTMEETASFWDCGEFIAVSYKLMVPHPPGAPFFLLVNRIFSFFAFGDVMQVAWWINFQSALSSAFTILFLYWTIVLLGKKIIKPQADGSYTMKDGLSLIVAGVIGATAYTFSDSFWFSAVEAEVYAMSSAFTAFVFWAILKWEHIEKPDASNRWLLMIAYVTGLSIGIHLQNLLTIPALAMIYYFHRHDKITLKGTLIAMAAGGAIIIFLIVVVIPGFPSMAFAFDKFFVNSLGTPFNTGGFIFLLLLIGGLGYGVYKTQVEEKVVLNNILIGLVVILIGYMSYGMVLIRSNAEPPINENAPEDLLSFVSYLKREQYGDRPLLYGRYFDAEVVDSKLGEAKYRKSTLNGNDYYEVYDHSPNYTYDHNVLFPRMYSKQSNHPDLYRQWTGLGRNERPKMGDNLYYFFRYQLGHMYLRYFMWNFAGRESDEKDAGFMMPWDSEHSEDLPEVIQENKARVNFYMLPFFIGLLGLLFMYERDKKSFWVVMILFLTMGVGLVVYLNSPPVEPRERDYIYAASFYFYAIWIGFGALALSEVFSKFLKGASAPILAGLLTASVPLLMGAKGWEAHDRSNRWHSVDQARNTLASCAPNAILFTGGDNDTFPLWYVQNVEGFRTDVRVAVLSYFNTGWYLKQMKQQQYESAPIPLSISLENYREGKNDYIPLVADERAKGGVNIRTYLRLVNEDNPMVQVPLSDGTKTARMLSETFVLDVDSAKVMNTGAVTEDNASRIENKMVWSLKKGKRHVFKGELALMDLIASNNWERPIYFNNTSANTTSIDLRPYLHLEGMTYRLLPVRANAQGEVGEVNTDVMLENVGKFAFRGFQDTTVYYDDEFRKFGANTRHNVYRLAENLYLEGRDEEAKKVMDDILAKIPDSTIPYSFYAPRYADLYHKLGDHEKADEIVSVVAKRSSDEVAYYLESSSRSKATETMAQRAMVMMQQVYVMYNAAVQEQDGRLKLIQSMQEAQGGDNFVAEKAEAEKARDFYKERLDQYYSIFRTMYDGMN